MEMRDIFKEISDAGIAGYNYIDPLRKLKALNQIIEMMQELALFRNNLGGLFEKLGELKRRKINLKPNCIVWFSSERKMRLS
jgi:hypothetical protein